jgi:hypothetical protein
VTYPASATAMPMPRQEDSGGQGLISRKLFIISSVYGYRFAPGYP